MPAILNMLRRVLVHLLVFILIEVPSWQVGWADALRDAASAGQAAGAAARQGFAIPWMGNDGRASLGPGSGVTVTTGELIPGSAGGDRRALERLFGDPGGLDQATGQAQQQWLQEPSPTGEAYRTVVGSRNRAHPDLSNDPIWRPSDAALSGDGLAALSRQLADCRQITRLDQGTRPVHTPQYRTCERVFALGSSQCTLRHNLSTEVQTVTFRVAGAGTDTGTGGMSSTYALDLVAGSYRLVAPSDAELTAADIPRLDPATLCAAGRESRVEYRGYQPWADPPLPATDGFWSKNCEEGGWILQSCWVPPTDEEATEYRLLELPTCANGLQAVVRIADDCSPVCGERSYRQGGEFRLRLTRLLEQSWTPAACLANWQAATADGFCTGSAACRVPPDANGCIPFDGVAVCTSDGLAGQLLAPPGTGLAPLCGAADLTLDCRYAFGPMTCWHDPQGVQHCPTVTAANAVANPCTALEQDPTCGFLRSECVDGAQGASGTCYVFTDIYDCGYTATIPTATVTATEWRCPGALRCLGTECVTPAPESNLDFAGAVAALQAAQAIAADASCGANDPTQCEVFKGEPHECKKAVGGVVNCCTEPAGTSLGDYLTLMTATLKFDSAMQSWQATSQAGQAVQGAWQALREPVVQTWDKVIQPFTSAAESVTGSAAGVGIQQAVMNGAGEAVGKLFGKAAQSALFSCTGCETTAGYMTAGNFALSPALQMAASVLSFVMWVYMVYQITMIVIQIVWACEEEEFLLGSKRVLKSCHYLGSYCATKAVGMCIEKREAYCCFNSPLSRILQEQIRPQLGMDWGDPKNPNCAGIPVGRLAQVDWNQVNLDEWLAILSQTGRLPTVDNASLDRLTGSGSVLNTAGNRLDTRERTQQRLEGVNVDGIRNQVGQDLWGIPVPVAQPPP